MANVKVIHFVNGEDVLGDIIETTETTYTVKNPCLIGVQIDGPTGKPNLSLQPLVFFSRKDVVTLNRSHEIYAVEVDNQIETQYNQMFGNIVTPQSKIIL